MDLKSVLRQVPDFPKPGINFIDITTLLADPAALKYALDEMAKPYAGKKIDKVIGIESRGFMFGVPLAERFNAGFVPVRKPKKLPSVTYSQSYELEYGTDTIEIHQDAIQPGENVIIVDDLLATGGTAAASIALLKNFDCEIVGVSFVIELTFLSGKDKLAGLPVHSLVRYDSE
jgi:adenine phosphoribosyltransferase